MSIIIAIASNIAVLVSNNVIFIGYFVPMSHCVNENFFQVLSTIFLWVPGFHQVCCYFTRNILLTSFSPDQIISHFSTHFRSVLIFPFVYMYFYGFYLQFNHYDTTNQSFSVCMLSNLASHQITCYTKKFIVWKLQVVVVFSVSEGTKIEFDTTSIVLRYLFIAEIKRKNYLDTVDIHSLRPCKQSTMLQITFY